MVREGIGVRALPVEFLLGQGGIVLVADGALVLFALLPLGRFTGHRVSVLFLFGNAVDYVRWMEWASLQKSGARRHVRAAKVDWWSVAKREAAGGARRITYTVDT